MKTLISFLLVTATFGSSVAYSESHVPTGKLIAEYCERNPLDCRSKELNTTIRVPVKHHLFHMSRIKQIGIASQRAKELKRLKALGILKM